MTASRRPSMPVMEVIPDWSEGRRVVGKVERSRRKEGRG